MSEFGNEHNEQNNNSENENTQVNKPEEQDYRQSSESANTNQDYYYSNGTQPPQGNGNPYYTGNNAQQGGGYYGSNYGYNRKTSYVYNGNNVPYGSGPYTPESQRQYSYNPQQNGYGSGYNPEPRKPKNNKKGIKVFVACLGVAAIITVIIIVLSVTGVIKSSNDSKQKVDGPTIQASDTPSASSALSTGELSATGVYEKVKESSVGILVYSNSSTKSGEGSGVIIGEDDSGKYTYIMTCAHVIKDGGNIKVQLFDETQYDATVIGYDSRTDIGVVRIAASGLTAIEVGDSEKISVGETVYAIGNPGGVDFAGSFTNGMVSAIARPVNSEIGYEMNCIQHTAAINPGNSGGALVNSYGQLIGINSSKIASTEYEGMGFSVPSSTFIEVYNEIIKNGYVTNRPKLGIAYAPASASQTYSMLVGAKGLPKGSLVIRGIDADSSLANTEVQTGDLITAVNGKALDSADTLPDLIENSKVGDTFTLSICHFDNNYQATEFDINVTLVEDKGTTETVAEETTSPYFYNPFGSYGYGN